MVLKQKYQKQYSNSKGHKEKQLFLYSLFILLSYSFICGRWLRKAEDTLGGSFEITDWDVFSNAHEEDIDGLTDHFLHGHVRNPFKIKTVHCIPSSKPWVTKNTKASMNRKKAAFRSGDKEVQIEL